MKISICINPYECDIETIKENLNKLTNSSISFTSFEENIRNNLSKVFKDLLKEEEIQKFIALAKRLNHYKVENDIFFIEFDGNNEKVITYCYSIGGRVIY